MKVRIYKIKGMHCASCASMIELDLEDIGINAKCNFQNETLEVPENADKKIIMSTVRKSGYEIG